MPFHVNQVSRAEKFICPHCEKKFILRGTNLTQVKMRRKRSDKYVGPFCHKFCAAKYQYYKLSQHQLQLKLPF